VPGLRRRATPAFSFRRPTPRIRQLGSTIMMDGEPTPGALIDARLAEIGGWRAEALAQVRALIHEADPDVLETVKWRKPGNPNGVPVWEHAGIICTGEVYKASVKLTFAQGAALPDPAGLFNGGFGGNTRRVIDLAQGAMLDPAAFKALVRAAVTHNLAGKNRA
jgi:hypothetical protein